MNTYQPMMARTVEHPFNDPNWVFEVKWDGIRAIAYVNDGVSLKSRNKKELIEKFPELMELSDLTKNIVLDGEIVILKEGLPNFQAVAQRNQLQKLPDIQLIAAQRPATYIVFDILEAEGVSLLNRPLNERKNILSKQLKSGKYVIQSDQIREYGIEYYQAVVQKNLEGIIAKRSDSTYQPGIRSPDWLKIKKVKTCDCVVFGYSPGKGSRSGLFGALILGLYDGGKPVYVGKVGTGFTNQDLARISRKIKAMNVEVPWFDEKDIPPDSKWIQPRLVAKIGYREITQDQRLRDPRFQGFREDKPAPLCSINQIKPQLLEEYYKKRDFSKTTEPKGGLEVEVGNRYVVQKHDARKLHYDLRLERDGVLVSWAVPKGIPIEPNEKRLAIQTEDHPLEYGGFEGIIPKGQYGAGTVEIWDHGFYVPVKWESNKVEVVIAGERVKGRYELIRLEKSEKEWILFKKK
jgi:DNA ligase D-like protein (predicted ligase)/DNA ligase D-like protein (predicted 3'-phosphoesterase)